MERSVKYLPFYLIGAGFLWGILVRDFDLLEPFFLRRPNMNDWPAVFLGWGWWLLIAAGGVTLFLWLNWGYL